MWSSSSTRSARTEAELSHLLQATQQEIQTRASLSGGRASHVDRGPSPFPSDWPAGASERAITGGAGWRLHAAERLVPSDPIGVSLATTALTRGKCGEGKTGEPAGEHQVLEGGETAGTSPSSRYAINPPQKTPVQAGVFLFSGVPVVRRWCRSCSGRPVLRRRLLGSCTNGLRLNPLSESEGSPMQGIAPVCPW